MIPTKLLIPRAVLVYQAGIANVFAVENIHPDPAKRLTTRPLVQGAFETCQAYANGLSAAGATVTSMACNEAGDIADRTWHEWDADGQNPFRESQNPVIPWTVEGGSR